MPRVHESTVYKFEELSEKAKEKAIEQFRDINVDHDWWDCTYDDAKELLKLLGFQIEDIFFSGFWSQGDGACFTGRWYASDVNFEEFKNQFGAEHYDEQGFGVVPENIRDLAKKFPTANAKIYHSGRYSHSNTAYCEYFDVDNADEVEGLDDALEEFITQSRRLMDWIYERLEKEYEYLTSDEQVKESIIANEYEFTASGRQFT